MIEALVAFHNIMRWLVLLAALLAIGNALTGWLTSRPWTSRDRRVNLIFSTVMDVQVTLGIFLWLRYVSSLPDGFGAAMRIGALRFFAIEHLFGMIVALILIHIGQLAARGGATDAAKHRRAAIFFIGALLVILVSIPWPMMAYGRSLFPVFG
ncbi:MAG: hypothetical protein U0556_04960 [Dehalococcoidia bacterium]